MRHRLLPSVAPVTLAAHLEAYGPSPAEAGHLIAEVEAAGVRGRGGAGFPTALKLAAVARGRRAVVVVNATEGEPASAKDKVLLAHAPHLVLDGASLAGEAVGAQEVIVAVERSHPEMIAGVEAALAERRHAGIDRLPFRVVGTPSRYVAGEETALVHWLNGGEARPTFTPPRPFERGVAGRPTLVDNAETLAHVALVGRYGAAWYRSEGTADDPGTTLLTITGAVARPGVYEVAGGSPMRDALDAAGADLVQTQAVLVGGYFGTWISAGVAAQVDLSAASLRQAGTSLGCGVLVALPVGACGLGESARVARWMADQNAGQCGPCVNGLPAIADDLDGLAAGGRAAGRAGRDLPTLLGLVNGRGACRHPDGVVRFVQSALRVFSDEVAMHHHRGPCQASGPWLPTPQSGGWR
jgi:NADH:ubiquinone oxidoreductase subunit F (NADH-binding)